MNPAAFSDSLHMQRPVQGTNPVSNLALAALLDDPSFGKNQVAAAKLQANPGNPGVSAMKPGSTVGLAGRQLVFYTTVQSTALVIKHYSRLQVIWDKGCVSSSLILAPDAFFGRSRDLDKD